MRNSTLILAIVLSLFSFLYSQDKGSGGPDTYGYRWIDSDETGGPVFSWTDISGYGTPLNLGDEETSGSIYLGFYVQYYGNYYSEIKAMSNGYLSFTSSFCEFSNAGIPDSADPNAIVAPFWCDLDPSAQGNIYYYNDYGNSRFIVQYENIVQYGESSGNTFQVLIYSNGEIYFQYKTMGGSMLNVCTAGIENQTGTDGLQVAYNTTYIKNNLAVKIYRSTITYDGTLSVSENSLSYGNVTVNQSSSKSFTISNLHSSEVLQGEITTITGYTVSETAKGESVSKNVLEYSLNPNSSMNYNLVFEPQTAGAFNGYIIITSSDVQNTSDSIYVTGTGAVPNISVSQTDTLSTTVYAGGTATEYFDILNNGTGNLEYRIRVSQLSKGSGAPDAYGYIWRDSDNPDGPDYRWAEISDKGTSVTLGDEGFSTVPLGFTFKFYGNDFTNIKIGANGFLTFTSSSGAPTNDVIPSTYDPNNVIAAFWDDLDPSVQGNIYYYYDSLFKRFIVEYVNIARFGTTAGNTFQIIIYSDGFIRYQYKQMSGLVNSCTVGIENSAGDTGLQVIYNSAGLKNEFAIDFCPSLSYWLCAAPKDSYLLGSTSQQTAVSFNSLNVPAGKHYANLYVDSTDPDTPTFTIPVEFNVLSIPAPALSTPVNSGLTTDLTPTFDWSNVSIATSYTLLVDNDADFSSPEINQSPVSSTYTPVVNMAVGTYYWKVRTNTAVSSGDYSTAWSVQLGTLPVVPTLSSPANTSSTTDLTPTFDWSDVATATSYTILADNNSNFSSPEINQSPTVSTYTPVANLASGTYYWKVLARNAFGSSAYTASWTVRLQVVPAVPANITCWPVPVSGNLYYNWDDSANATGYDIYSSPNPYGIFTFLTHVAISEFYYTPTPSKMFFYILATNATKESPTIIEVSATDR